LNAIYNNYGSKRRSVIFRADIIGTVFSGSSDTTLMNTVRMASYNMFTLYKTNLPQYTKYSYNYRHFPSMNKGDDFVNFSQLNDEQKKIVEETYYKLWKKKSEVEVDTVHGLGQIIKILEVKPLELSNFCSCIVFRHDDNYYYVRDPKRLVQFSPFSRKAALYKEPQKKQYLIDQAVALKQSGVISLPLFRGFYQAYMTAASNITVEAQPIPGGKSERVKMLVGNHKYYFDVEELQKYDVYRYDMDHYYSMIKNARMDQLQGMDKSFYENCFKRYKWTEDDISEYEYFLTKGHKDYRNYFNNYSVLVKSVVV
jgi:hypothetical protein